MSESALVFLALALLTILLGSYVAATPVGGSAMVREWRREGSKFRWFANNPWLTLGVTVPRWSLNILILLLAALLFLLFWELLPEWPLLALFFGVAFYLGLLGVINALAARRRRRFEASLVHANDLMIAALTAAQNPTQALATTAAAMQNPIKRELEEMHKRLGLGLGIVKASQRMVDRYDSEGVRLFVQTLQVKWESGGNLAEMLLAVNRALRARMKIKLEFSAQISGLRQAALALSVLPYMLVPFFFLKHSGWAGLLLGNQLGVSLLAGALALQLFGFVWLRKIIKAEI